MSVGPQAFLILETGVREPGTECQKAAAISELFPLDSFIFQCSFKILEAIFLLKYQNKNLQFNFVNKLSGFFYKQFYMTPFRNKISAIDKIWIDLAPNFASF